MIKTNKIEKSRYQSLKKSGYTLDSIFDKGQHEDLKKRLLNLGGEAVILVAAEPDKEPIMTRGCTRINPKIYMIEGEPNECHSNSAYVWSADRELCSICTGYALSADGIWRQHSWVVSWGGTTLIETTEKRVAYHGFTLNEVEAEEFLALNY